MEVKASTKNEVEKMERDTNRSERSDDSDTDYE